LLGQPPGRKLGGSCVITREVNSAESSTTKAFGQKDDGERCNRQVINCAWGPSAHWKDPKGGTVLFELQAAKERFGVGKSFLSRALGRAVMPSGISRKKVCGKKKKAIRQRTSEKHESVLREITTSRGRCEDKGNTAHKIKKPSGPSSKFTTISEEN